MSPRDKLEAYREFFAFCDRVLVSRGRLSLQTIAYPKPVEVSSDLISNRIFPESELPLIWEPLAAAEGRFELLAMRNDREHYFRTLRLWDRNLAAAWDQAVALIGQDAATDFRQYLRLSAAAFQSGMTGLLRLSLMKLD